MEALINITTAVLDSLGVWGVIILTSLPICWLVIYVLKYKKQNNFLITFSVFLYVVIILWVILINSIRYSGI